MTDNHENTISTWDSLLELIDEAGNQDKISILNNLGRAKSPISSAAEGKLISLLDSESIEVRRLSIKSLAKLNSPLLTEVFVKVAKNDKSSSVAQEAVSAIGRLRDESNINILKNFLANDNPEIVLQAILGLLAFKDISDIKATLSEMSSHPNEIIREVIEKEMHGKANKSSILARQIIPYLSNLIVHGDSEKVMEHVPDGSVHLTFTSPPYYNARDYSTYKSYSEYLDTLARIFAEVHRVTKEGRFLLVNTSPVIIPRIGRAYASKRYPIPYDLHAKLVEMEWEFIDDIIWVKPEASVKNRNAGFSQHRKPLAYKPNAITENIMVYRKKSHSLIDWNISQYSDEEINESRVSEDYERTNVWHIPPTSNKLHSAVFPAKLCENVIKYYSYTGDLVFDPFAGSGTLGKAAMSLGRKFFLIEKMEEYARQMKIDFKGIADKIETSVTAVSLKDFRNRISS